MSRLQIWEGSWIWGTPPQHYCLKLLHCAFADADAHPHRKVWRAVS